MIILVSKIAVEWPSHLSYDKGRANVDEFYDGAHGAITKKRSIFYNKRLIDIFLLAMAIGKKTESRKKLKKPSITLNRESFTKKEIWMMCSVVLSDDKADLETITHPKEIVKTCEEYANGGIDKVMDADKKNSVGSYEEMLDELLL